MRVLSAAMTATVLVPMDGSPLAERALEYAFDHHPDADVLVLHVIDPVEAVYVAETSGSHAAEEWVEAAREEGEHICDKARERADERGVEIETATEFGKPARVIGRFLEQEPIDHVVMGSHGRSALGRLLLGSVSEAVLRRSPVPVTIIR